MSTDASRNASTGPIRPARRAAAHAPANATDTPAQKATWYGHTTAPGTANHVGATLPATNSRTSKGAPHAPSAHPAPDATTPTATASPSSSRRT